LLKIISKKNGYGSDVKFSFKNVAKTFKEAVWALGATVIILGGILGGIFTATEAAAVAVCIYFWMDFNNGKYSPNNWKLYSKSNQ